MIKLLAFAILTLALLLLGFANLEGTVKGPGVKMALAVETGGRTVILRAHAYRYNRTYLVLTAR